MKSYYFTHETISNKSLEMLQKLEKSIRLHKINFIPKQSALLVLDMQRFFLDECSHAYIPSALPIIPKIKRLADAFNEINLPVILTRHINSKEDAKLMAQWWKDLISEKDNLSEIIPELNLPNSIVIRKTQYDGFYQTPLENILRENGISQLIITGVMTHLCCETTARSAFIRGFTVFFPIDGTATYNENFHWATLLNLSHGFAIPVLMKELQHYLDAIRSGH
ncbi:MAG: isochorismatase family protein [Candidatus Cloacimonetes bacterium]|nr:isochorismatase family protein [Candidatus Cloacimonadota bacterium]